MLMGQAAAHTSPWMWAVWLAQAEPVGSVEEWWFPKETVGYHHKTTEEWMRICTHSRS